VHKPQRNVATDPDQEYRAIEVTLLETARGRWFLAEHGRRARRLDNALLEDALHRLKSSLRPPMGLFDQVRTELQTIREDMLALRQAMTTRASTTPSAPGAAPPAPSQVQRILASAESVHELAWTMQGREGQDFDQRTCEEIARHVVAIYAMSRAQATETELTVDNAKKLAAIDERLSAIIDTLAMEARTDHSS
jgi:hypothetical protein